MNTRVPGLKKLGPKISHLPTNQSTDPQSPHSPTNNEEDVKKNILDISGTKLNQCLHITLPTMF